MKKIVFFHTSISRGFFSVKVYKSGPEKRSRKVVQFFSGFLQQKLSGNNLMIFVWSTLIHLTFSWSRFKHLLLFTKKIVIKTKMLYYFHVTLYIKYSLTQVHKNGPQIVVQYYELDVKFIRMDHKLWYKILHLIPI